MKTDTELTTKPLPARIGGFALLPSLSPTSPASSPNPKNASSLGFSSSVGSAAPSTAGNRTREQIGLSVTQSSYNNLNQLTGQSAGGPLQFSGSLNKPGTVTVGGNPTTMGTGSTNFTGTANVTTGTNAVAVVATNVNGNAATNNYQVVVPANSSVSPTYDANGNMSNNGKGQTYTWDAKNDLITIIYTSGATSNFAYDGFNRRVKIIEKNSSGTVTSTKQYVWIGNAMAEEWDGSNTVTKRFFSQGEQQGGTVCYYTNDHLGSIREMVDSSGTIQVRYSYDSYGSQTKVSGSLDSTFQYTGDYYHGVSGLSLTMFRAYDAGIGKWLSRDYMGEKEGFNLYEYVSNNPIYDIDPLGLATWTKPLNPNFASGFANQSNVLVPPTVHQGQKGIDAALNYFGVPGDPAGANSTAATVTWFAPCGDYDIIDMKVLTVPEPGSGNPQFSGKIATIEVKTRYAIKHTSAEALKATTAKFKCNCTYSQLPMNLRPAPSMP